MSMCVRYAGDSYRYLLDSVTTDHGRAGVSPMTRYYTAAGTPPGTWMGAGLTGLAGGAGVAAGSFVTPRHMERLFRDALDPATGEPLGRSPHLYSAGTTTRRRPVAGFDCTFTVPKSFSVLWGVADDATREALYDIHRTAVADVVAIIEREVARTRIGTNGVAQVDTRGVVAAAFDHWDSRENDPNLHTHLVIANRVQGPDGRWRTLDSKAMHRAVVAMSERYDAVLADHVTARLGLGWEYRERGPRRNPSYELTVVPPALTAAFSRRSTAITEEADRLIAAFVVQHGHQPDAATILKLRQQATLTTRGDKDAHSLAELSDQWRQRAGVTLGTDPAPWLAAALSAPAPTAGIEVAPATASLVAESTVQVLAALSRTRSTWSSWNVDAEASRALKAVRFLSAEHRDRVTAEVVAEVARRAVLLAAPELATTPAGLRRSDGASAFRPHRGERYTSHTILDAETRLLAAGRDRTGPTASSDPVHLSSVRDDQLAAVADLAGSGRVVDVLVGPAGSGKTRTVAALRSVWEAQHGPGSVTGLAPSAAAATVLATALGVPTENTAKWLVEHGREPERVRRIDQARAALHAAPDTSTARTVQAHVDRLSTVVDRWRFHCGQLVIVDEASLAGTVTLDRLAACAGEAGAKLLLVGDWAQLSSIEAGGAFGLLVRDRGTAVPELGGIRRFTRAWEREASTRLRTGDITSIDTYAAHERITDGDHDHMVDAAYACWVADERAGKDSLLLAGDLGTVRALNERARAELVATGLVEAAGTSVRDGLCAGVGDRVVTRRNDRHLITGRGWVKNGDRWTVVRRHGDGALDVQRPSGGAAVTLPARYVAEHLELGYATTAYRAQGSTVDTAHAIVTGPGMTREVLYVMLTRAREANHAYVCTNTAVEPLHGFTDEPATGRSVLAAVLQHRGSSLSAHETIENAHEAASSIRTLAAEYETIAHHAEAPRWLELLASSGVSPVRCAEIESSSAFGALTLALRRAQASGLDVAAALPRLVAWAGTGADDVTAVLHGRVERWVSSVAAPAPDGFVVGLLPPASADDQEEAQALQERAQHMEARANALVDRARTAGAPWLTALQWGGRDDATWYRTTRTIAAYRERWDVDDHDRPLGAAPAAGTQQARERDLAARAMADTTRPPARLSVGPAAVARTELTRAGL